MVVEFLNIAAGETTRTRKTIQFHNYYRHSLLYKDYNDYKVYKGNNTNWSMTTIALTDEVRNKLGLVNKYNNFVKNANESLGETIDELLDEAIKNKKIKIPQ